MADQAGSLAATAAATPSTVVGQAGLFRPFFLAASYSRAYPPVIFLGLPESPSSSISSSSSVNFLFPFPLFPVDKIQLPFGTSQFSLFQFMDQFRGKINFSSGGLAFGLHEFAVVERPPIVKLGIQPVNISPLEANEFTFSRLC